LLKALLRSPLNVGVVATWEDLEPERLQADVGPFSFSIMQEEHVWWALLALFVACSIAIFWYYSRKKD
jgi:hypothetical protein